MDAPEALQTCQNGTGGQYACGAEASAALRSMVDGRELRCEPRYIDRYRRTVRMARRCSLVA
jgi:endonuclease YncB( thermonuclease family)